MFIDDGVSRDSAPNVYTDGGIELASYRGDKEGTGRFADVDTDPDAKGYYREYHFQQVCIPIMLLNHHN